MERQPFRIELSDKDIKGIYFYLSVWILVIDLEDFQKQRPGTDVASSVPASPSLLHDSQDISSPHLKSVAQRIGLKR